MIEVYLARLARELAGCADAARVLAEARDHLEEAAAAERARGAAAEEAARRAIARFGSPGEVARGFAPRGLRRLGWLMKRRVRVSEGKNQAFRCSFCGKGQEQVRRLIAGPNFVYICDECVALCNEIIAREEGQPQPSPA